MDERTTQTDAVARRARTFIGCPSIPKCIAPDVIVLGEVLYNNRRSAGMGGREFLSAHLGIQLRPAEALYHRNKVCEKEMNPTNNVLQFIPLLRFGNSDFNI